MPRTSPNYCKKTPKSKMGFSQIASCKAQGLIARTSRKNKGRKIKSKKYSRKITRKSFSKKSLKKNH